MEGHTDNEQIKTNGLISKLNKMKWKGNVTLKDYVMSDNLCLELANYINENDNIEKLEGTQGEITSKGLSSLSNAIAKSKKIKLISFAKNKISDNDGNDYFENFCKGLFENKSVEELDLSFNRIGPNLAIHLASLIKKNATLKSINLESNILRNEGCKIILNSLEQNSTLTFINLEGNAADTTILERISQLLSKNKKSFLNNSLLEDRGQNIIKTSYGEKN